jgi:hypothetical protein
MSDFLFTYTVQLRQPKNADDVYPFIEQIVTTGLVDEQVRKENNKALRKIELLGEDRIAATIRKRYSKFI